MKRFLALALLVACGTPASPTVPPLTVSDPSKVNKEASTMSRKMDLVEFIHGQRVADPYRWLEDGDTPEVHTWTEKENARTRALLDAIPIRASLQKEIKDVLQIGVVGAPSSRTTRIGTQRYFHTKREGAQNQPTLWVRDGLGGKDRALIDVASLSEDGTTALDWWYPSWDGSLVAWGKSESGSEESTLFIRDATTGKDLPDRIERTRHASLAWLPDGKSFYYSRYPEPGTVPAGEEKYGSKIYLHVLGTDPKTDKKIFGDGREKTDIPEVQVSPNGRYLVISVFMGWDKSDVFVRDLSKGPDSPLAEVAVGRPATFEAIVRNDRMYLKTNEGAPRYKVYAVEYDKPERASWKDLIPEGQDVIEEVAVLKNEIVVTAMHEAASKISRYGLDGSPKGEVMLPAIGSAGAHGAWDSDEAFIGFTSYVMPTRVYRLDLGKTRGQKQTPTTSLEMWDQVGSKFTADDIEIQRLYATSKDGTKVPMYVIAKKGMKKDGKNPAVLYGYGGFNVNQTPAFSARALAAVRHGAVWVTSVLRGGGELGEDWHKAGMLEKKQNVFDDFIACAETLVKEKITTPEKLGIIGGSNGGLLVAAAVTQRPDLFRVGLSLVPLTDMIRYPRYRIAKLWVSEYGDPEKPADFNWLYAYSPYHHVKPGTRYPSMLFTTAESDSRVDPMHARKMAAAMQEVETDAQRPVLIRIETKAGHGAGKPVSKLADELSDELSFLLNELGITT